MRQRLTVLADKKGWTGEDREERAMLYLEDGRLSELDTRANELLSKVDQLGRPDKNGKFDCSKLGEIEATSIELLAIMKTKAAYLEDKVAREVGPAKAVVAEAPAAAAPPAAAPKVEPPAPKTTAAAKPAEPRTSPAIPPQSKPAVPKSTAPTQPDGIWDSKTNTVVPPPGAAASGTAVATAPAAQGSDPNLLPPVTFDAADQGYTIDEIREASRGFFGAVSTNLASVIEYAFANSGRPSGYILGTEGGGAFLAGLRYGKGTLYLRQGGTRPIYWHGPSLGYDVGAEGGRTLILVYSMRDPNSSTAASRASTALRISSAVSG